MLTLAPSDRPSGFQPDGEDGPFEPEVLYERPDSDHVVVRVRAPFFGFVRLLESHDEGWTATLEGPHGQRTVRARAVVNAAGLRAPSVTRSLSGVPLAAVPREHFAKGHYFTLARPSPFRHLVYPVPEPGGLGVHVTLDLGGTARFGPDVAWQGGVDYAFDERRAPAFYAAVRAYFPALADGELVPGYTGIRPKLGPAGTSHDFRIDGPAEHGVRGFVALYGIESPGLTASLALADEVAAVLGP